MNEFFFVVLADDLLNGERSQARIQRRLLQCYGRVIMRRTVGLGLWLSGILRTRIRSHLGRPHGTVVGGERSVRAIRSRKHRKTVPTTTGKPSRPLERHYVESNNIDQRLVDSPGWLVPPRRSSRERCLEPSRDGLRKCSSSRAPSTSSRCLIPISILILAQLSLLLAAAISLRSRGKSPVVSSGKFPRISLEGVP